MAFMRITVFDGKYTQEIIDLVLSCQNDGTRPVIGVESQPDLLNIQAEYIEKGGNFWVALEDDKIVGTIAFYPYSNKIGAMKKFFVNENFRGYPNYLGQKLYAVLLEYAKSNNFSTIILDTPYNTKRAHKFYQKAGFKQIPYDKLPIKYPCPYEIELCDFFILNL